MPREHAPTKRRIPIEGFSEEELQTVISQYVNEWRSLRFLEDSHDIMSGKLAKYLKKLGVLRSRAPRNGRKIATAAEDEFGIDSEETYKVNSGIHLNKKRNF